MWQKLSKIARVSPKVRKVAAADWNLLARELGLCKIPDSYRLYWDFFGDGVWREDLIVCDPADIVEQMMTSKGIARAWEERPDDVKDLERLSRLVPVAGTTSGFYFSWDPVSPRSDGEMPIFMSSPPEILEPCGSSFYEFMMDYWVGGKINDVYRFSRGRGWTTGAELKSLDE